MILGPLTFNVVEIHIPLRLLRHCPVHGLAVRWCRRLALAVVVEVDKHTSIHTLLVIGVVAVVVLVWWVGGGSGGGGGGDID